MIFSDRFEAGQKLAQKILDEAIFCREFSPSALAFSPESLETAKGMAQVLKIPLLELKDVLDLKNKIVFLVDDGSLGEKSFKIAINKVRLFNPKKIVVAMPIIAKSFLEEIKNLADQVFYLESLEIFFNTDQFYQK